MKVKENFLYNLQHVVMTFSCIYELIILCNDATYCAGLDEKGLGWLTEESKKNK